MALQRNYRHFFEALVKLVPPLWGKPRVSALMQSYLDQVQELEDATWDVLEQRHVNAATGVHLDTLGAIVGVPRFTSNDDTYRNVIRAKIAANKSSGRVDDLITVTRLAGEVTSPVRVTHISPATIRISLSETVDSAGLAALTFLLPRTRSAGVRLGLQLAIDEDAFVLDDSAAAITGAGILDNSAAAITGAGTLASVTIL